jgi:hypothetical protein
LVIAGDEISAVVRDARFEGNYVGDEGGALDFRGGDGSQVSVQDCVFEDNFAELEGGAVAYQSDASDAASLMELVGCSFVDNQAGLNGGAIEVLANYSSDDPNQLVELQIEGSTFEGNSTQQYHGGVLYATGQRVTIGISDSVFSRNDVGDYSGGAMYLLDCEELDLQIVNSEFSENSGGQGGAIKVVGAGGGESTRVSIEDTLFESNSALYSGGALVVGMSTRPSVELDGVMFYSNTTGGDSGACSLDQQVVATLTDVDFGDDLTANDPADLCLDIMDGDDVCWSELGQVVTMSCPGDGTCD